MRNPIVIIGGMGPQASLRFHELLIQKSRRYHGGDGDAYPFVVHFSLPVADFISDDAARKAAVQTLQAYTAVIERLEPSQITLACNTAHLLIESVTLLQSPSFVSMVEVVAQHARGQKVRQVGILASPTTIRTKLYEKALGKLGIDTLTPTTEEQVRLEAAIRAVIAGDPLEIHAANLLKIAKRLRLNGAEAVILGCTELPLVLSRAQTTITTPIYDCLDIYAEAVIARHYLYNGA